jgi:hypothetical protein
MDGVIVATQFKNPGVGFKGGYHVDSTWRPLYKIGAVALLVEGLAYLTITVTSPVIGVAPGNNMKYLHALAVHSGTAAFTYTVVAIADFALIPSALALYFALREISEGWMLLATVIILTYVAIDIATFVSVAIALVVLANEPQSATIVSAEHFGLATVPLSQFIGWVFPALAFVIIAVVIRVGHLGRFTSLLGFLTVIFSIIGGIAFLHPVTSLQNFQLPALALMGFFSLALGAKLLRLERKTRWLVSGPRSRRSSGAVEM